MSRLRFEISSKLRGWASEAYHSDIPARGIATVDIEPVNIEELVANLKGLSDALIVRGARALGVIGLDLLTEAVNRCPVATGDLRRSGTAVLYVGGFAYTIGEGTKEGNIKANLSALHRAMPKSPRIDLEISFFREGDKGFDVALWTHEDLAPYGFARARVPGTGPKYLEGPYRENYAKYAKLLRDVVAGRKLETDIRHSSKITRKAGKFTVRGVRLDKNKLKRL